MQEEQTSILSKSDYKLYTGQTVSYSDSDWDKIVTIASERLASFLCLVEFPELTEDNADLAMLLANFVCASIKFAGNSDTISQKSVRNFTISFKSNAANAFQQIYSQYEDIIEKYSQCELGIKVESSRRYCCGYYNDGLINF